MRLCGSVSLIIQALATLRFHTDTDIPNSMERSPS
jgi:hypothetical protein